MSGISDFRWRSNRFTGDQIIFTGDQIDSPRSASKITKCVTGLKNKEPSKRKNYAPLIKLMEDDDSNLLREKIPLDNIVDDTVDVIRESPSRVLIIISAFFSFTHFTTGNTLPLEENLSREVVGSLISSEVC